MLSEENIGFKLDNLEDIGYNEKQINKLISNNPNILINSVETMNLKIKLFMDLGYTKSQIIKMSLKACTLFDLDVEVNIKKKLEDMLKLGFTYEQLIKMTVNHPDIFTYSIDNITKKMEDIEKLGFSKENVIRFLYKMPSLFGLTFKNIEEKIKYLIEIDAIERLIEVPTDLMQSVRLTYARYEFFKDKNIDIKGEGKLAWLFIENETFEKRFSVSAQTLLTRYNYNLYCEEKNNEKLT